MAKPVDFFRSAALTYGQQIGRMSRMYPQFRHKMAKTAVAWVGELQPSPISENYTTRIEYSLPRRPKILVLHPLLYSPRSNESVPHTFADGSLCLHRQEDWTGMMFIAETIIPWLSLWLYHYEYWLATGEWLGGGH